MISIAKFLIIALVLSVSNGSPISKVASLSVEQVVFQLYTRETAEKGTRIIAGNLTSLDGSGFDASLPLKLMIHGWMDDAYSIFYHTNKNEFLALAPMNVIAVDWSECTKVVLYEQCMLCAKQVASYSADLIKWLIDTKGVQLSNVHLLGHSLGAQAVSYIAHSIKVPRISGLDPAGPLFSHNDIDNRLDKTDADFVDVLHTSSKILGFTNPTGHIDFYPNGGKEQPGCGGIVGHCAHSAAHAFYAWSITHPTAYVGHKCDSMEEAQNQTCAGTETAVMGYGAVPGIEGIYYLEIPEVPQFD